MQCSVLPHPLPFGFWSSELKTTPEHVMVFVSTLFCVYERVFFLYRITCSKKIQIFFKASFLLLNKICILVKLLLILLFLTVWEMTSASDVEITFSITCECSFLILSAPVFTLWPPPHSLSSSPAQFSLCSFRWLHISGCPLQTVLCFWAHVLSWGRKTSLQCLRVRIVEYLQFFEMFVYLTATELTPWNYWMDLQPIPGR